MGKKLWTSFFVIAGIASLLLVDSETQSQTSSGASDKYAKIREIKELSKLSTYLDTSDAEQARYVVRMIGSLNDSEATALLKDLWNGGKTRSALENANVYNQPIVRLMVAQQLLGTDANASRYYQSYIKDKAHDDNWIIKSYATEALGVIGDRESIQLLADMARAGHYLVALNAVKGLETIARFGPNSEEAFQKIRELRADLSIKSERLQQNLERIHAGLSESQNSVPPRKFAKSDNNKKADNLSTDEIINTYLPSGQHEEAIVLLQPRATNGDVKAQHVLGEIYIMRKHDASDYASAVYWLQKAVSSDYAPAKFSLAQLYLSGRGVELDQAKAVALLDEAAQQGYPQARELLQKAKEKGWWGLSPQK